MLDSASWLQRNLAGDGASIISLNNLTDGQDYVVQIFSSDTRGGRNRQLWLDNGESGEYSTTTGIGTVAEGGGGGLFVLGSFTADNTGQASFTMLHTDQGGNANINAISVIAVPEPSSAALLGLAGMGFLVRRRK